VVGGGLGIEEREEKERDKSFSSSNFARIIGSAADY